MNTLHPVLQEALAPFTPHLFIETARAAAERAFRSGNLQQMRDTASAIADECNRATTSSEYLEIERMAADLLKMTRRLAAEGAR